MKNSPQIAFQIRDAFMNMKDKQDLLDVLNIAKSYLFGPNSKVFALRNLNYYADPRLASKRYSVFHIAKKQGGLRTIHAPVPGLKAILRCLNFILQCVYENDFDAFTTGFVPGKSVVDNAWHHTCKSYVFNLDLKDFFPSVDLYRVKAVLGLAPFNLKGDREPLAYLLANLCCHVIEVERLGADNEIQKKLLPVLPQGAPTSPTLTNIVCRRLDYLLRAVAKRFDVTYSRYADDITFSGNRNIFQADGSFIIEVRRLIADQRFVVNEKKVRLQHKRGKQEVTGITVNLKPNLSPKYVKDVRKWLYLWETYGDEKAEQIFSLDYQKSAGPIAKITPPLVRVLEGKLLYMKMVLGEGHPTFYKLWSRYDALTAPKVTTTIHYPIPKEKLRGKLGTEAEAPYQNHDQTGIPIADNKPQLKEAENRLDETSVNTLPQDISKPKDMNTQKFPWSSIVIKKIDAHKPRNTTMFLAGLYEDPVIKAALHKWDGTEIDVKHKVLTNSFNHPEFINELRKKINSLKKLFPIQKNLDTKIGYFFYDDKLFSTKNPKAVGWSEDHITISWNSEIVKKWCRDNPNKWPVVNGEIISYEGLVFNTEIKFNDKPYKSFADIMQKFIHEIRFKGSDYLTNDLMAFFNRLFDDKKYQLKNEINSGVEFNTDVEKFEQALRKIRNVILENIKKGNIIILKSFNTESNIKVEVIHLNSYIDKTINSFHEHDGDTIGSVRQLLTGVCEGVAPV
jgi:RNA-directed DNA polymerase